MLFGGHETSQKEWWGGERKQVSGLDFYKFTRSERGRSGQRTRHVHRMEAWEVLEAFACTHAMRSVWNRTRMVG